MQVSILSVSLLGCVSFDSMFAGLGKIRMPVDFSLHFGLVLDNAGVVRSHHVSVFWTFVIPLRVGVLLRAQQSFHVIYSRC